MLRIVNINKSYSKDIKALCDINLNIGKGIFGLIGPNGSGKSTLMRTIATLQRPDNGSIFFEGKDIFKNEMFIRNILGYLPQEFGIYPNSSAEDLLDHIALLKGISDKKKRSNLVMHLFELTNLYQFRKKKLGSFSGGMKQRFGIAQTLLNNPRIIIVDEPTAGLDPNERDHFHNILSNISENITVIFSTHIVADVNELCNDMAIIKNGKILFQSSPKNVIQLVQNKIFSKIIHKNEVEKYKNNFKVVSYKLHCGKIILKIFNDIKPQEFDNIIPTLEDVYFSYIKTYI